MSNLKNILEQTYQLGKTTTDFESWWEFWNGNDIFLDMLEEYLREHRPERYKDVVTNNFSLKDSTPKRDWFDQCCEK